MRAKNYKPSLVIRAEGGKCISRLDDPKKGLATHHTPLLIKTQSGMVETVLPFLSPAASKFLRASSAASSSQVSLLIHCHINRHEGLLYQ